MINRLTEKELKQIKDIQARYQQITQELGNIEIQRIALKKVRLELENLLRETQEEERVVAQTLESTYGKVSIDLDTGAIREVKS